MAKQQIIHVVKGSVGWKARRSKAGVWVAICDALNITVQGNTWGEMQATITEALDLLMRDIMEDGELDAFLRDRGWKVQGKIPARPSKNVVFDIPTHIESMTARA